MSVKIKILVSPADAYVTAGCDNGIAEPTPLSNGRGSFRVPVHAERAWITVAIPDGDGYVEDAIYNLRLDGERIAETHSYPAIVRATDTEHDVVVRSTLRARLSRDSKSKKTKTKSHTHSETSEPDAKPKPAVKSVARSKPETLLVRAPPALPAIVQARDTRMRIHGASADAAIRAIPGIMLPPGEQSFVVRSEFGLVPIEATFRRRAVFSDKFAEGFVKLLLATDAEIDGATLNNAGPGRIARFLSRIALFGVTVKYTPDRAMTTRGLEPCNLYTHPAPQRWEDDCEGCTAAVAHVFHELQTARHAYMPRGVRAVIDSYVFHVGLVSIAGEREPAQHVVGILIHKNGSHAVLLEGTTWTRGTPTLADAMPDYSDRSLEVPLAYTTDNGRLNNYYDRIHGIFTPGDRLPAWHVPVLHRKPSPLLCDFLMHIADVEYTAVQSDITDDERRAADAMMRSAPAVDLRTFVALAGETPLTGTLRAFYSDEPVEFENQIQTPRGVFVITNTPPPREPSPKRDLPSPRSIDQQSSASASASGSDSE